MSTAVSPARRREVLDALRRGTVPASGLDLLAVGLDRFIAAIDAELDTAAAGGAAFKAVRGDYGTGKTFFARWVQQRALDRGFAVAEVQISEVETPLHRLETVYRRVTESLRTSAFPPSAFRSVLDAWLFAVEADAADEAGNSTPEQIDAVLSARLSDVGAKAAVFPVALRGYLSAVDSGDETAADALSAWLAGQPHIGASAKRAAGIKGDIDHFLAMAFLQGLLALLRGSRHTGLVVVLDEVETLQRMRTDTREKALNALRQWIDEIDTGRYPGLYLLITGTPAFFDGRAGLQRLPPLAARLSTDFSVPGFDNPRAPQLRLTGFDFDKLVEVGIRVRNLYVAGSSDPDRVAGVVDDKLVGQVARTLAGSLGVEIAPRLFLRKLVDLLDRVDQFPEFDPRSIGVIVSEAELTDAERISAKARSADLNADDVEL